MSKIVARLNNNKDLQISGEFDETKVGLSLDQNGNFIGGKELIEESEISYRKDTTKEDFNQGTLNNVVVKDTGELTLNDTRGGTITMTEDFEDDVFEFTFIGDWVRDTSQFNSGTSSYRTKDMTSLGGGQHNISTSKFTVDIPADSIDRTLSFYYKVSSEANYDWFNVYVNGAQVLHTSGEVSWTQFLYNLPSGSVEIKFEYNKDGATDSGLDNCWIDDLVVQYTNAIVQTNSTLEDFEDTTYNFAFTGDWVRDTSQKYEGVASFRSKDMASVSKTHSISSVTFTANIPTGASNGLLSLYYKVSSEANYDWFNIYIDNVRVLHKSGEVAWTLFEYSLGEGSHTIKFEYDKDGASDGGLDNAWVDKLIVSYDNAVVSAGSSSTGDRISPAIDLSNLTKITDSKLSWVASTPTGSTLTVESCVSIDNGQTWSSWVEQTNNGGVIASIDGLMGSSNTMIKIRTTLTSNSDGSAVPIIYEITTSVFGESTFVIDQTSFKIASLEEGVVM